MSELLDARPVQLEAGWEKPVEGHPDEAGQARMRMSIHVKVVGLSLVPREHVPARVLSRTSSGELTCPNAEGTRAGRTDPERRERLLSRFVPQIWPLSIPRALLQPWSPVHKLPVLPPHPLQV